MPRCYWDTCTWGRGTSVPTFFPRSARALARSTSHRRSGRTYSVWVQDGNVPPSNYELRFTLVPVPGTALLAAGGLASLAGPGILRSLAQRARAGAFRSRLTTGDPAA